MPYKNGVVSCGTTATLIASPSSIPENGGILIQNLGATVLYLGGSTVTANTAATGGIQVAVSPSAPVLIPTSGAAVEGIYGVSTAAVNVAFLYPS